MYPQARPARPAIPARMTTPQHVLVGAVEHDKATCGGTSNEVNRIKQPLPGTEICADEWSSYKFLGQ